MTKYIVTEGDYNDVFSKTEMEFNNNDEAEIYALNQFSDDARNKHLVEDLGTDSICFGVYYPVTDDNGNEIDENDPRYEDLSEQQELRLQYYIDISEIDDTLI